jgi:hypothetical protein
MVISSCCAISISPPRSSRASLRDRTSRERKAVKLPAAARYQKGPELSARDASSSPARIKAGFIPFMALLKIAVFTCNTVEMVASASDKLC